MANHPATKGVVLYPDGTYARRVFDSLEKMQESVGGLIEIMRLPNATAYINEEGKLHDLDFNNNYCVCSWIPCMNKCSCIRFT